MNRRRAEDEVKKELEWRRQHKTLNRWQRVMQALREDTGDEDDAGGRRIGRTLIEIEEATMDRTRAAALDEKRAASSSPSTAQDSLHG